MPNGFWLIHYAKGTRVSLCFFMLLDNLSSFPYGTISIAPESYFYLLYFKSGECFILVEGLVMWGGWLG